MSQITDIIHCNSVKLFRHKSCFPSRKQIAFKKTKFDAAQFPSQVSLKLVNRSLEREDAACDNKNFIAFPHVQTLSNFPKEELFRKVVMVRFNSVILQENNENQSEAANAFSTIKYLYEAGAKVIMVGSWSENNNFTLPSGAYPSTESVADFLSSMLELRVVPVKFVIGYMHSKMEDSKNSDIFLIENLFHFKGEVANCSKFAKKLASGVDIIVNDAFSETHKVLASTVGIARFCYAYIAGFHFEDELYKMKNIVNSRERPYIAIIGGGKLVDKANALRFLVSTCDGLVFVGSMAFQIMHALGIPVPLKWVELGALKEAASIVESAKSRNIPIVIPKDIWCTKDHDSEHMEILSVDSTLEGWQPVDIGPRSLQEMISILSKCKKIMWIGSLKFSSSRHDKFGTFKLVEALRPLSQSSCNLTFVGNVEFNALFQKSSNVNLVKNAAVVWELLKGRKLPGLMALDRAYPFRVDWDVVYGDPARPLVVDVGSGNGLFLFGMARRRKDMNFLGLEMNAKLVDRCLENIDQFSIQNVYFITTNATSTFKSIVSSYPGELVLVSVQVILQCIFVIETL
ncbi:hypothetical protein ACJIZ3_021906 [Penstemon smallii]|uniref:Phosphoglycerate kinase n=1 Tax=Penstemon smallii TaxID=265156 RepID=A0ABD3SNN4_9LAMI